MSQKIISARQVLAGDPLTAERDFGLFIDGERIADIAPVSVLLAKYPNVEHLDYGDATLLPGLIDCHTHLDWDCTIPNYVEESQECEGRLAIIGQRNMALDLRSGVTTARYMGGHFFLDIKFREYVRSGFVNGPKVKASGIGMRSSAGHGYIGIPTDGEDAIISTVRKKLLNGADWIKFYSTGSHLNAKGFPSSFYTEAETRLIIDMAHRAGVPVTSHCVGGQGMTDAIACGIDCLEHCYFATDDHIEMMLKAGTHVCLTMSEYFTEKEFMPTAMAKNFEKYRSIVHQRMRAIISSGIPYVLGTDGMHGRLWEEAVYLVEHGGTPESAVRALTVDAARLLGVADSVGSLEVGKAADILVVAGAPLSDITALSQVLAVYQNGMYISRS